MGEKMTLLPCPFCGNADDFEGSPFPNGRRTSWIIRCGVPNCGCDIVGDSPEGVTKRWNTRHLATPSQTVDVEAAYRAGFIEACKWPKPVSQDAYSPAFYRAMAQYKLAQAIGDKT